MDGTEHNFSEQDLKDLNEGIQGQLKEGFEPAVVKGHPKVDSPREASVVDSRLADDPKLGKVVEVKIDEVNPEFAEEAQKGQWKYFSAAVYKNLKKGLRHLGALGANPPAMKGLELAFGEGLFAEIDKGENQEDIICFAQEFQWDTLVPTSVFRRLVWAIQGLGTLMRGLREQEIAKNGIESADKVFPSSAVSQLENADSILDGSKDFPRVPPAPPAPSGTAGDSSFAEGGTPSEGHSEGTDKPAAGQPTAPAAGSDGAAGGSTPAPQTIGSSPNAPEAKEPQGNAEETARLQAENEALKARLASAEKAESDRAAFAEFGGKLDAAQKEGRLNADQRKKFEQMFGAVRMIPVDGEGCFGEGDGKVNPMTTLSDTLAAMPKIVEFGERAQEGRGAAESAEEYAQNLTKYMSEQKAAGRELNFAEASEEYTKTRSS